MAISHTTIPRTDDSPSAQARRPGAPGPGPLREKLLGAGDPGLAGLAAVVLLVSSQRWGAYLGVPCWHLFLTDVLLLAAILRYVVIRGSAGPREDLTGVTMQPWGALAVAGMLVLGVVRYLVGAEHGAMAVRDAAPFLYVVVVFLAAGSAMVASSRARALALRVIEVALIVHLVWVVIALAFPRLSALPAASPGAPVRLLELRSDIDGALLAVLAAWGLVRLGRDVRPWLWLGISAAAYLTLFQMPSRVGPLAALLCSMLALLAVRGSGVRARARGIRFASLVVVIAGFTLVLPMSPSGLRLIGSVLPAEKSLPSTEKVLPSGQPTNAPAEPGSASADAGAEGTEQPSQTSRSYTDPRGTTKARWATWQKVLRYWTVSPSRIVFGVGFGPNIVREAGATAIIGESADSPVRSPHTFLLTVLVRTGLVGSLVLAGFILVLVRAGRRALRGDDGLVQLSAILVAALSVGALLGVIMESPFGAVPAYWATGVLLAAKQVGPGAVGITES